MRVCFVFDGECHVSTLISLTHPRVGAYPALKFPTLVSRATQNPLKVGQLFFRTSSAARSTPRFLRENSLLPPLSFAACVETLRNLAASSTPREEDPWLELHFADEEGDPYAVALAARLHAYVVGRDSDFVVLNADGYQGYIPLDEMVWVAESAFSETGSLSSTTTEGEDDVDANGFKTVRKSKSRKREQEGALAGRGLIPPSATDDTTLSLVCNVYTPAALATKLQIPVSLLPLLGALVGNDFTSASSDTAPAAALRNRNLQYMFFERQLTLSQRITRVADTLRELLGPEQKRKRRKQIGSVMELIDAAVHALLLRPPDTMASGEMEAIVERIVEATLQYAIPRSDDSAAPTDACALHGEDACRLVDFFSRLERDVATRNERDLGDEEPYQAGPNVYAQVRDMYVAAYRRGDLSPRAVDVLNTGTTWVRLALEDPDKESVSRSVTRPIRLWCYALLDAGVGLPAPSEKEHQEEEVDSDDELIDVVEEDSDEDYLSPLRTALERLDHSAIPGDAAYVPPSLAPPPRPKVVTEYLRRSTRLASEEVTVPFIGTLLDEFAMDAPGQHASLPMQLWSEELRLTFLLRALASDTPHVRAFHGSRLTVILAIRWIVIRMHARAEESPTLREKQLERWTREEVQGFLSAFSWSASSREASPSEVDAADADEPIPIEERNIQLVTQVGLASDAIEQFAQLLFVGRVVPNPMIHFSGVRLHRALTTQGGGGALGVADDLLDACLDGLDGALMTKPTKAKKKRKDRVAAEAVSSTTLQQNRQRLGPAAASNMYDVLAAMSA